MGHFSRASGMTVWFVKLMGDLEGEVEVDALLVHEDAHELRAAHRGVRVVRVDAHALAEVLPVGAEVLLVAAQDGLQTGRDEEVLLLEAQDAAVLARVVGVQDHRDGLNVGAELARLGVVAGVEGVQVEVLGGGLGAPQAQLVHDLAAVADDGHVVGHGAHEVAALLGEPELLAVLVAHDVPAKAHEHGGGVLAGLPGEAVREPVVGALDLAAALDVLVEEAVAVAHAVAVAGHAVVRHGREEARGEAAEAAIAQARVDLLAANGVEVGAHVVQGLGHEVAHAQVDEVVVQKGADEELEREVVDLLLVLGVGGGLQRVALGGDELGEHRELLLLAALLERLAELGHAGGAELLLEVLLGLEDGIVVYHATPLIGIGHTCFCASRRPRPAPGTGPTLEKKGRP